MTVTIVLGNATDGYLYSYDATYTNSRNGPADGVTGGAIGYVGQNHNSTYQQFQTFLGFTYTAIPATEKVVAAQVHVSTADVVTPSRSADAELRLYAWSAGGLITGDWRNIANLAALPLMGQTYNLHMSEGARWVASADALALQVQNNATVELVVATDRQRAGNTPTVDEGIALYTADQAGTTYDPALIISTTTRSRVHGVLGAAVELSDGTWVQLTTDGTDSPDINLTHTTKAGVVTTVGNVQVSVPGEVNFGGPAGAQAIALAVDSSDHLYVVGRQYGAQNVLAVQAFTKNVGYSWTPRTIRTVGLTAYDGQINNVVVAWHSTAGGRLMVLVGHAAGTGANSGQAYFTSDLVWALLDSTYLRTNAGTLVRGGGSMVGTLVSSALRTGYHGVPTNETGSMLDVAAAGGGNPAWGFLTSANKYAVMGDNSQVSAGRYIINAAGTGLDHVSTWAVGYGVKDANAKLRAVRVSDTVVAVITTDSDAGWGFTIETLQYQGTTFAPNVLGYLNLGGEIITNLPAESVLSHANSWDAVYNETENRLWIYYVDSTASNALRRTAIDLSTMQPLRNSVVVSALGVGAVINAIRIPRNSAVTDRVLVQLAHSIGGVSSATTVIDLFNLPPTAPVLNPPTNYDATIAKAFTWTPTDPNAGDTQSAYQLQIMDADLGTTALDTGKIVSTASSHNVAGGTLANTKSYQWRVKTWDASDSEGEWSGYGTFQTSAGGAVTITDPAVDSPPGMDTDDYYISWSVTGTVQASYRVILRRMSTLAVISDTGWVTSTATTALVSGMLSDVQYRVEVQVRNAGLVLSGIGQRLITPSYATPEPPVVTLSELSDQGYILVSVANPIPGQPEVVGSPEYGFEAGASSTTGWTTVACTFVASQEQAHTGTWSAKLTVVGSPSLVYARDAAGKVPVTAGVRYTARMWAYRTTPGQVSVAIDWSQEPSGTYVSTSAGSAVIPANTWTLLTVTGVCPAGAGGAIFGPTLVDSPAAGTVCYVDDMALTGASDRPDVARNQVLRRPAGTMDPWTVVGEVGVDGSVRDYEVTSGKLYEYMARGITTL